MALMRPRRHRVAWLAAALVLAFLMPLPSAVATFPGENGPLLTPGGVLNEDGTSRYTFNTLTFYPAYGAFSADGAAIAYSKCLDDCDRNAIRIRTASGSDTEVVVLPQGLNVQKISWSPDGTRLAVSVRDQAFAMSILLIGIQDGSSKYLVQGNGGWDPETPDWQPTGELIAYTVGNDLFTINATTSVITQRTFECTYDTSTPDSAADCNFADGEHEVLNPSWHPGGEHIVVDVVYHPEAGGIESYVSMMTLGSSAKPVTIDIPDTVDYSYSFSEPIVSPDGSKVALTYEVNLDNHETWIAPLGTGTPVSMGKDVWISDWQPCPSGAPCPSFSTERTAPTLKVTVLKDAYGLNTFAKLTPAHAGSIISLKLDKRTASGWRKVTEAQLAQNTAGLVVKSFVTPRAQRCRVTASWAGDADHLAVTTIKSFAC